MHFLRAHVLLILFPCCSDVNKGGGQATPKPSSSHGNMAKQAPQEALPRLRLKCCRPSVAEGQPGSGNPGLDPLLALVDGLAADLANEPFFCVPLGLCSTKPEFYFWEVRAQVSELLVVRCPTIFRGEPPGKANVCCFWPPNAANVGGSGGNTVSSVGGCGSARTACRSGRGRPRPTASLGAAARSPCRPCAVAAGTRAAPTHASRWNRKDLWDGGEEACHGPKSPSKALFLKIMESVPQVVLALHLCRSLFVATSGVIRRQIVLGVWHSLCCKG